MKNLRLYFNVMSLVFMVNHSLAQTGNVGIGTTTPKARLHVADSAVVFTSPLEVLSSVGASPPVSGPGVRMMWYPQQGAFRAGAVSEVTPDYWDANNIGQFSFSSGYETKAKGIGALSMGVNSQALADFSISLGIGTTSNGTTSVSMGSGTTANGNFSTSMGILTEARAFGSMAIGMYNDPISTSNTESSSPSNPLFIVGNGNSTSDKSNAMVVFKSGNTSISGFTKLGSDAPAIKVKKYIINTSSTVGGVVELVHGLNAAKILGVNAVLAYFSANDLIPPGYLDAPGFEYNVSITDGKVFVRNKGGNSSQILNKQVRITITYEE